jgi:hypothetical protein
MNSKGNKVILIANKISDHHLKLIAKLPVKLVIKPSLSTDEFAQTVSTLQPNIIGTRVFLWDLLFIYAIWNFC